LDEIPEDAEDAIFEGMGAWVWESLGVLIGYFCGVCHDFCPWYGRSLLEIAGCPVAMVQGVSWVVEVWEGRSVERAPARRPLGIVWLPWMMHSVATQTSSPMVRGLGCCGFIGSDWSLATLATHETHET